MFAVPLAPPSLRQPRQSVPAATIAVCSCVPRIFFDRDERGSAALQTGRTCRISKVGNPVADVAVVRWSHCRGARMRAEAMLRSAARPTSNRADVLPCGRPRWERRHGTVQSLASMGCLSTVCRFCAAPARERGRHAAFRAADFTAFLQKETALLRRTATAVDPTVEAMRAVPKPAALVLAEATNPPRSSTSATRSRCWSTVPSAEHRYRATRVENIWRCGHCTIGSPRPYARADSGHDDHIAGHRGELHRLTKVDLGFALVHRGRTTLAKMRLQLEV